MCSELICHIPRLFFTWPGLEISLPHTLCVCTRMRMHTAIALPCLSSRSALNSESLVMSNVTKLAKFPFKLLKQSASFMLSLCYKGGANLFPCWIYECSSALSVCQGSKGKLRHLTHGSWVYRILNWLLASSFNWP